MEILNIISVCAIPMMFIAIISIGLYKNIPIYDCFMQGAKEGIETTVRILPALVGLLAAVSAFRASGALSVLIHGLSAITNLLHIPSEVMPLALMRPISGSASLAIVSELIDQYGADSFIGRTVSVMMGSTETVFYTIAIYFSAVGIKKIRHTMASSLLADAVGLIASVWVCSFLFGA